MILPAAASRFWLSHVGPMCVLATAIGTTASVTGLLFSYHASLPSGPAIILACGAAYLVSALLGPRGVVIARLPRHRHRTA